MCGIAGWIGEIQMRRRCVNAWPSAFGYVLCTRASAFWTCLQPVVAGVDSSAQQTEALLRELQGVLAEKPICQVRKPIPPSLRTGFENHTWLFGL
jgi:hypothetical protein